MIGGLLVTYFMDPQEYPSVYGTCVFWFGNDMVMFDSVVGDT